mmetsp:Transcript_7462/g.12437  ORF Transcript_7462/g.12437 Transcript_7462/m.12437 type:complete len:96 (+) Transcript_7462:76-363(+)|eukprot:CAMPEP_0119005504 /NCGR_PEP_ID=MMETSP1176-20130426/1760_1 /TAXON_ID=265551 /ORGANISM="Synedropsis recta cf, Strain CCMP1620" /LENGTH=95 /DNA_ID=CAMNT_0006957323 /DNA_START=121 /DNA_END=408 /DNA_ORIENTATION=+
MAATLKELKDKSVTVVTCDGRLLVGLLAGYDQVQNVILKEAHERVYDPDQSVELVPLGLYVIRGDNVALVGEVADNVWDDELQCDPLPVVQQHAF